MIDNQRNHELGASQSPLEIPVALPGSVLTSLLSCVSDRNSLILLTLVFCHGFRPDLEFCHGFATVNVRGRCIARGSNLESDKYKVGA